MESVDEVLNPTGPDQQDEFTRWLRGPEAQFLGAKRLPDGSYAGVVRLAFTCAICLGPTYEDAYQRRFCYENIQALLHEYQKLTSINDTPEGWVARRPAVTESSPPSKCFNNQ